MITVQTATHDELARMWARWHGLKGTAKQCAAITARLSVDTLRRMLVERGVQGLGVKPTPVVVRCAECGKTWRVSANTPTQPICSRCGGADVEVKE